MLPGFDCTYPPVPIHQDDTDLHMLKRCKASRSHDIVPQATSHRGGSLEVRQEETRHLPLGRRVGAGPTTAG